MCSRVTERKLLAPGSRPAAPSAPLTPASSSCKPVFRSASHRPTRNSKKGRVVGECGRNAQFRATRTGVSFSGPRRCQPDLQPRHTRQRSRDTAVLGHQISDWGRWGGHTGSQRPARGPGRSCLLTVPTHSRCLETKDASATEGEMGPEGRLCVSGQWTD